MYEVLILYVSSLLICIIRQLNYTVSHKKGSPDILAVT